MVSQNMVSQSKNVFPKYGFSIKKWIPKIWFLNQKMDSQNMVSQSKNGFPKYGFPKNGFSIKKMDSQNMVSQSKKWIPKRWFLNQKMVSQKMVFSKNLVNYMFPNQTSAFSRYPATDSSKCASTTDSICFRAIIECITSYDSSVWFKLIVYKVKYSICCFKTLRYLLLTIFVCLTIYLFFFLFFSWFFQMVYCLQISIGISLCCLWHLL